MRTVDVTPGRHPFTSALGTVSFKLACGCSTRPSVEGEVYLFKKAGGVYDCSKHGGQVITRSTERLTGWAS